MSTKNLVIELRKGLLSWHYVIKNSKNGKVLSTSETYFSRSNCERAAETLAEALNIEIEE